MHYGVDVTSHRTSAWLPLLLGLALPVFAQDDGLPSGPRRVRTEQPAEQPADTEREAPPEKAEQPDETQREAGPTEAGPTEAGPTEAGPTEGEPEQPARTGEIKVTTPQPKQVPLVLVVLDDRPNWVHNRRHADLGKALAKQLDQTFSTLGIAFTPHAKVPSRFNFSNYDKNRDLSLSQSELHALRDDLERRGLKRPGRVVVVVTAATFVMPGCRGWTIGDAMHSAATLGDINDNFSVVGSDFLDRRKFHTLAHEVGHQLGLDDLRAENRYQLVYPARTDHLMESGGSGHFLDPAALELLRYQIGLPMFGLSGRRGALIATPSHSGAPTSEGLAPPLTRMGKG